MSNIYGRQVVLPLTNKSGGGVIAGDVVIIDTSNDSAFTTTTTGQYGGSVGIAQDTIASNATGRVLVAGEAALVNVPSSMTRGRFLETHTVVKQGTQNTTRRSGSFGQFTTGGTTPKAWLWGFPDNAGAAALTVATDTIWDAAGDMVIGTGADTAARVAIGSSGKVWQSNGTTASWQTPSGSSGGRGEYASKYNPDHETPATATADAEEFNTSTGMAWTSAPGVIDDLAGMPGFYHIQGNNTERHLSKAWVPGASDITIAAKLSCASGTTAAGGIAIYAGSATGNPGDGVYTLFELSSGTVGPLVSLYNENTSSFSLIASVGLDSSAGGTVTARKVVQQLYLRLTRAISGPVWTGSFSYDGRTWYPIATTGSKALTVAAFGMRFDVNHDITVDWIRVWSSVVSKVGA